MSSLGYDDDTPFCGCGEKARLNTSWTNKNPGRRFWGCPNFWTKCPSSDCDFFQWFDPDIEDRCKIILKGLLTKAEMTQNPRRKGDKERICIIGLLNNIVEQQGKIRRSK